MKAQLYCTAVMLFILLVLTPNLRAIILNHEDWPYTPAPMFAHYIDQDTPRYSFIFLGEFEDGSTKRLGYYSVGANWSLMRFFFKYVYGAAHPGSVFEEFPNDNRQRFEERLTRFFGAFSRRYLELHAAETKLASIRLSVAKLAPNTKDEIEIHQVGVFKNGVFIQSWKG